jgi:16S rRNA C967 or C1407 C5-methylase (RsmB/RsmF family)
MVLDICAAPGYKTSQILEIMINKNKLMKEGCVIANDAEARRVQMLTQKVHDSGTINLLAINHSGQYLP